MLFSKSRLTLKRQLKRRLWVHVGLTKSPSLAAVGTWAWRPGLRPHWGPRLSPQDAALSAVLAVCSSAGDALEAGQQAELVEAGSQLWASLHGHLVRRRRSSPWEQTLRGMRTGTGPAPPGGRGLVSSAPVQRVVALVGVCGRFSSKWLRWVREAAVVQPPASTTSVHHQLDPRTAPVLSGPSCLLGLQAEGQGTGAAGLCLLPGDRAWPGWSGRGPAAAAV